jgi:hypothetical protein
VAAVGTLGFGAVLGPRRPSSHWGFRGGPIFPAVFLGIGVATLPVIWFDVSPTFAIAVGAAAGMAAHGRLILTSMLFAALLVGTQGFDAIPGAVLAAPHG